MRIALGLARRGLGSVWPNPAVGCVIVRDDGAGAPAIVGRGWTQPGGRPHAETEALARAGDAARGATAYVSLEPCNHHGKTPPCTEALIAAGIARVVAATEDPDPRVSGSGLKRLADAGIAVDCGLERRAAEDLNAGFIMRVRHGRPLVCLKTATTLDGRIATHTGESQWITGPEARARVHLMRARYDAVMVGVGTAVADDPALTARLPGLEGRQPVRVVVDARLRLPLTAQMVQSAGEVPTWIVTRDDNDDTRADAFRDLGVELIALPPSAAGYPDPAALLAALGERGLTRVLVEGGATLAAVLLRAQLIDRIAWFRSGGIVGGDGIPAVEAFGVDHLAAMARFERHGVKRVGADLLETFSRRH
jgi:diaminohydroxyphosphoribosylaminopyrimidine deaminase/5-amino-6-(5-phosphoribosylamino)uracil reductase